MENSKSKGLAHPGAPGKAGEPESAFRGVPGAGQPGEGTPIPHAEPRPASPPPPRDPVRDGATKLAGVSGSIQQLGGDGKTVPQGLKDVQKAADKALQEDNKDAVTDRKHQRAQIAHTRQIQASPRTHLRESARAMRAAWTYVPWWPGKGLLPRVNIDVPGPLFRAADALHRQTPEQAFTQDHWTTVNALAGKKGLPRVVGKNVEQARDPADVLYRTHTGFQAGIARARREIQNAINDLPPSVYEKDTVLSRAAAKAGEVRRAVFPIEDAAAAVRDGVKWAVQMPSEEPPPLNVDTFSEQEKLRRHGDVYDLAGKRVGALEAPPVRARDISQEVIESLPPATRESLDRWQQELGQLQLEAGGNGGEYTRKKEALEETHAALLPPEVSIARTTRDEVRELVEHRLQQAQEQRVQAQARIAGFVDGFRGSGDRRLQYLMNAAQQTSNGGSPTRQALWAQAALAGIHEEPAVRQAIQAQEGLMKDIVTTIIGNEGGKDRELGTNALQGISRGELTDVMIDAMFPEAPMVLAYFRDGQTVGRDSMGNLSDPRLARGYESLRECVQQQYPERVANGNDVDPKTAVLDAESLVAESMDENEVVAQAMLIEFGIPQAANSVIRRKLGEIDMAKDPENNVTDLLRLATASRSMGDEWLFAHRPGSSGPPGVAETLRTGTVNRIGSLMARGLEDPNYRYPQGVNGPDVVAAVGAIGVDLARAEGPETALQVTNSIARDVYNGINQAGRPFETSVLLLTDPNLIGTLDVLTEQVIPGVSGKRDRAVAEPRTPRTELQRAQARAVGGAFTRLLENTEGYITAGLSFKPGSTASDQAEKAFGKIRSGDDLQAYITGDLLPRTLAYVSIFPEGGMGPNGRFLPNWVPAYEPQYAEGADPATAIPVDARCIYPITDGPTMQSIIEKAGDRDRRGKYVVRGSEIGLHMLTTVPRVQEDALAQFHAPGLSRAPDQATALLVTAQTLMRPYLRALERESELPYIQQAVLGKLQQEANLFLESTSGAPAAHGEAIVDQNEQMERAKKAKSSDERLVGLRNTITTIWDSVRDYADAHNIQLPVDMEFVMDGKKGAGNHFLTAYFVGNERVPYVGPEAELSRPELDEHYSEIMKALDASADLQPADMRKMQAEFAKLVRPKQAKKGAPALVARSNRI